MSASFYDLLKYAKTGIASQSMTDFDKQKALALFGGSYPVTTITGVPPITFKSDGTPLTAWSIIGNMQQTGTPAQSAPITPEECGDKTANLFNVPIVQGGVNIAGDFTDSNTRVRGEYISVQPETQYTISCNKSIRVIYAYQNNDKVGLVYNDSVQNTTVTFTTPENCDSVCVGFMGNPTTAIITPSDIEFVMLNTGSTVMDYEPFGYKIPITCGGTTHTVYLSEPMRKIGDYADRVSSDGTVTRAIKKVVYDGTETWYSVNEGTAKCFFYANLPRNPNPRTAETYQSYLSSHFVYGLVGASNENKGMYILTTGSVRLRPDNVSTMTLSNWTTWLADEYAAGHPVAVWYVLETPQTETVTVPTLTPAKGANTLNIGTTLQPSEVSITGRIKAN